MFSFKSFIVVGGGALFIWERCRSLLGFHSYNLVPAINTDKLATAPPPRGKEPIMKNREESVFP